MTSLANHQSSSFTKLLLIGDPKTGKTGSLVSLVKAGYNLRILDTDNLLDFFKQSVLATCPDRIDSVEFRTIRDNYKATANGMVVSGRPRAWIDCLKMLDNWKYTDNDNSEIDLGSPASWGPNDVLVIDSLSRLCDAAYDHHASIIPTGKNGEADGRAIYGNAQDDVEKLLARVTSAQFETNVIVIAHGIYMDMPNGQKKIWPQGIGQKLSPRIPSYFPNVIRYAHDKGKRTIQLSSDNMIDLANTNPAKLSDPLPVETGLAEFFEAVRGTNKTNVAKPAKPTALTLKRVGA